jgi:hypothetical protein
VAKSIRRYLAERIIPPSLQEFPRNNRTRFFLRLTRLLFIILMIGLRSLNRTITRTFSLHAKPVRLPPSQLASPVPQHELVDEEACPAYNPKYVYPAKPGEILANHYQLLVKIGWGTRSTIWLAKDIKRWALALSSPLQI